MRAWPVFGHRVRPGDRQSAQRVRRSQHAVRLASAYECLLSTVASSPVRVGTCTWFGDGERGRWSPIGPVSLFLQISAV